MAAQALIGYSNPNLTNKYPVKNELIDVILRNIEDLHLNQNVILLNYLCQIKKADKELLIKLKDHLLSKAKDSDFYVHVPTIITSF